MTHVQPGDRVGYAGGPVGSYSEVRVMPADRLLKLPGGISDQQAAAMLLKGMTAQYLIRRTYRVQPGETVLFHAAAGGVGLIACQWLKALGAIVIGTVGSEEKAQLAKANGCEHVINYRQEDFAKRVREITGGQGVPVVYDSVGQSTFAGSLDCLRPRGLLVSFGNASGPVQPFPLSLLTQKGSLYVTRPTLANYTASREDLEATAKELFDVVQSGQVKIAINHTYKLQNVQAGSCRSRSTSDDGLGHHAALISPTRYFSGGQTPTGGHRKVFRISVPDRSAFSRRFRLFGWRKDVLSRERAPPPLVGGRRCTTQARPRTTRRLRSAIAVPGAAPSCACKLSGPGGSAQAANPG